MGATPARFGMPEPFFSVLRCSRVELRALDTLTVDLVLGEIPVPSPSPLERLVAKKGDDIPTTPGRVASLPAGPVWPLDDQRLGAWRNRRRIRTITATVMVLAGVVDIIGAFLPALFEDLERAEKLLPFQAHHTGGVLGILAGLALIGLSLPLRRGYRPAYVAALVVLGVSVLSMLVHTTHIPEAVISLGVLLWLLAQRSQFRVMPAGRSRWLQWGLALALGAVALSAVLVASLDRDHQLARNSIALLAGLLVLAGIMAARPGRWRPLSGPERAEAVTAAREIVATYGGDTLDYFALARRQGAVPQRPRARGLHRARPHDAHLARPDLPARGASRGHDRRPATWPTATAGTSRCWPPAHRGCRSTTRSACTRSTWATKPSSTAPRSPSRAGP